MTKIIKTEQIFDGINQCGIESGKVTPLGCDATLTAKFTPAPAKAEMYAAVAKPRMIATKVVSIIRNDNIIVRALAGAAGRPVPCDTWSRCWNARKLTHQPDRTGSAGQYDK